MDSQFRNPLGQVHFFMCDKREASPRERNGLPFKHVVTIKIKRAFQTFFSKFDVIDRIDSS